MAQAQVDRAYQFASEPRAVAPRKKFRENDPRCAVSSHSHDTAILASSQIGSLFPFIAGAKRISCGIAELCAVTLMLPR